MRLSGKVVIVTGAGRGIGRAISLAFAEEGCDCAVVDIDTTAADKVVNEIKLLGRRAVVIKADVSKNADVEWMVKEVIEKLGVVDILVNNAGIFVFANAEDLSEEEWDRTMDINLKGTFLCSKAVGKTMIRRKCGKIINVASLAGKAGVPRMVVYCASKAGVISLTKTLAIEWAKYNINVNAIIPGITTTEGNIRAWRDNSEGYERYKGRIPLARAAEPEEIAKAAVFLASSDSDYMTGQVLIIDGGIIALHPGYQVPR